MTKAVTRRSAATFGMLGYFGLVAAAAFLPLPTPQTNPPERTIQLRPFQWVGDIRLELRMQGLSIAHMFATPAFERVAWNVVLFVPLGIFARLLWKRGFVGTALLGFACSLIIETTQLTANWGTSAFQYRVFDVDDLMTNTAGAMLGWVAAVLYLALLLNRPDADVETDPVQQHEESSWLPGPWLPDPTPGDVPAWRLVAQLPVARLADPPRQPSPRRP